MSPNECLIALEGFERAYSSALIWSQSVREGLPGFHLRSSGIDGIEKNSQRSPNIALTQSSIMMVKIFDSDIMVIKFAK